MKALREKQKKEFSSLPKTIKTNQGITEKKAKLQKSLIFYKRKPAIACKIPTSTKK